MMTYFNPLSAKFIKWSNTLKQIVGKLPTICLSVFDHFSGLAFKGLRRPIAKLLHWKIINTIIKVPDKTIVVIIGQIYLETFGDSVHKKYDKT